MSQTWVTCVALAKNLRCQFSLIVRGLRTNMLRVGVSCFQMATTSCSHRLLSKADPSSRPNVSSESSISSSRTVKYENNLNR